MKMYGLNLFFIITLFYASLPQLLGQTVSTLIEDAQLGVEAIAVSPAGEIYTPDFNTGKIFRISLDGTFELFAEGYANPAGGTFDAEGNYYVSEFSAGKIWKFTPGEEPLAYAQGLNGPAGLAFDPSGDTLYVAQYNNNRIGKISPDGTVSTFVVGGGLNGPDGVLFVEDTLYCINFNNSNMFRVTPEGVITPFASLPSGSTGYMAYRPESNAFYAASLARHNVYEINMDGMVSIFAGTDTEGSQDGEGLAASFTHPNGVALSPDGLTLYVGEDEFGRIRAIDFPDLTSSVNHSEAPLDHKVIQLYLIDSLIIANLNLENPELIQLELLTFDGKAVLQLQEKHLLPGEHAQISWPLPKGLATGIYVAKLTVGNKIYSQLLHSR